MIDDERFFETAAAAHHYARRRGARIFVCNDVLDIAVDVDGEPYVLLRENEGLRWDRAEQVRPAPRRD